MVIGWKDFPGDSAGLGACPWGMILQLAVIGWNAELQWEPWVIFSTPLACDPVLSEHDDRTVSLFTAGTEERENNYNAGMPDLTSPSWTQVNIHDFNAITEPEIPKALYLGTYSWSTLRF